MTKARKIEDIPGRDRLFYRVHDNALKQGGKIHPGCFKQQGEGDERGMSMDWERYSSAQDCRNRAREPRANSIVSFVKDVIGRIDGVGVFHAPTPDNQSHTNARWSDDKQTNTRVRKILFKRYRPELPSQTAWQNFHHASSK